jgi:hypothetical protein
MKLYPPCKVRVEGLVGIYELLGITKPNAHLKSKGWKSFVAHIKNSNGSKIVEYRKLLPVSTKIVKRYEGHHSTVKRERRFEIEGLIYEEKFCLNCGRKYKALGKLRNGSWFRIEWICRKCKTSELFKSPGLGKFDHGKLDDSLFREVVMIL